MHENHYIYEADSVPSLLSDIESHLRNHPSEELVFKRFFLSDPSQASLFPSESGAVSFIIQPPLNEYSVAVWMYTVEIATVIRQNNITIARADGLEHIWVGGLVSPVGDSESQTAAVLNRYESILGSFGLNIADHCVRTWFFCHDIDNNYAGLVKARRDNFLGVGLNEKTHYIASTGIQGTPVTPGAIVQLDAYAVRGHLPQIYLYAPTHLNPTYEYGVTFERGVRVDYSGSAHCLISGTASIDNKGRILHPGDVAAQTLRMWENVDVLLAEGGSAASEISMILVYIRNCEDYAVVAPMFAERFPDTPYIIMHAPVCRPGWLIEMECISVGAPAAR